MCEANAGERSTSIRRKPRATWPNRSTWGRSAFCGLFSGAVDRLPRGIERAVLRRVEVRPGHRGLGSAERAVGRVGAERVRRVDAVVVLIHLEAVRIDERHEIGTT